MIDLKQETDRLLALAPRMPRYSLAVDGQLVWIADDMAAHIRALQAEVDRLQGDLKHLREVRDPGGCECSDDDACMFARQRDAFKAECEALRGSLVEVSAMVPETQHARGFSTNALVGLLEGIGRTVDDAMNRERGD